MVEPAIARRSCRDPEASFEAAGLTEEERDLIRRRDWRGLIHYGVIFFMLEKLGAVVGVSNLHIYAAMRGETLEAFQKTRNAPGALYSVAGKGAGNLGWDQPTDTAGRAEPDRGARHAIVNTAERHDSMIIDIHGHYTTAPKALEDVAQPPDRRHQESGGDAEGVRAAHQRRRVARVDREQPAPADARARPRPDDLQPARQLHGASHRRLPGLAARGPRSATSSATASAELFPDHFIPAAMLPQSPGVDPATCIPELVKCVEQYGNVGDQPESRSVGRALELARRCPTATGTRSTRRWSSTTSRR